MVLNLRHGSGSVQSKASGSSSQQHSVAVVDPAPTIDTSAVAEDGSEVTASGWQADPNEPRYCICNDVSYGDMVGCDNEDVSIISSNCFLYVNHVLRMSLRWA